MKNSRRSFIKKTVKAAAATYAASIGFSAKSYANIIGANDRVRLGVVGFSDRFKQSHFPSFLNHSFDEPVFVQLKSADYLINNARAIDDLDNSV